MSCELCFALQIVQNEIKHFNPHWVGLIRDSTGGCEPVELRNSNHNQKWVWNVLKMFSIIRSKLSNDSSLFWVLFACFAFYYFRLSEARRLLLLIVLLSYKLCHLIPKRFLALIYVALEWYEFYWYWNDSHKKIRIKGRKRQSDDHNDESCSSIDSMYNETRSKICLITFWKWALRFTL